MRIGLLQWGRNFFVTEISSLSLGIILCFNGAVTFSLRKSCHFLRIRQDIFVTEILSFSQDSSRYFRSSLFFLCLPTFWLHHTGVFCMCLFQHKTYLQAPPHGCYGSRRLATLLSYHYRCLLLCFKRYTHSNHTILAFFHRSDINHQDSVFCQI